MSIVRVNFLPVATDIPMLRLHFPDGKSGCAIVDTGSEVTMISEDFAIENKSNFLFKDTKDKITYTGIAGNIETSVRWAKTNVKISEEKEQPEFEIIGVMQCLKMITNKIRQDDINEEIIAIIGSDWLRRYEARINMKNNTISFDYDLLSQQQD